MNWDFRISGEVPVVDKPDDAAPGVTAYLPAEAKRRQELIFAAAETFLRAAQEAGGQPSGSFYASFIGPRGLPDVAAPADPSADTLHDALLHPTTSGA